MCGIHLYTGWSDYNLVDEMIDDICYENDEDTEQQPNGTTHTHKKQDGKNFNTFALI